MEKREKRQKQKETFKKVLRYIKKYWFYLILSILLAVITVVLTLYIPILIGDAVDEIVGAGHVDFAAIFVILKRMAVVILATAAAQWVMNLCNNKMTYGVVQDIRNEAFQKIESLPISYLDAHSHGDMVSRIIADVDQFADGHTVFYRSYDNRRNTAFYAERQCRNYFSRGRDHTAFFCGSRIYCKTDIFHVPVAVRDQRRADVFSR